MAKFKNIHVNGIADSLDKAQGRLRTLSRHRDEPPTAESAALTKMLSRQARLGDESASRNILQMFLEDAHSETLLAITSPERPELVPDMQIAATGNVPDLNARSVTYQQCANSIPIFGGRVVVDIDNDAKTMVAMNGKLSPLPQDDAIATLSPLDAWKVLRTWAKSHDQQIPEQPSAPPTLTWYLLEDSDDWALVYHFVRVALDPPSEPIPADLPFDIPARSACCAHRGSRHYYDYFVDAKNGSIRFYFASERSLDIPAPMRGIDSQNRPCDFFGLNGGNRFLLIDPIRNIATYDFGLNDLDSNPPPNFPASAIAHPTNDFGNSRPDAVSAHYHATLVYDFFNDVLKRDGVDDKGMKLVSVVNVYSSDGNPSPKPDWGNAVWWQGKMWYGQVSGVSFAKYLDVIAHELTHGVTETSSRLIYRGLSGALNESYSDIFGIVVANWYPNKPNPLAQWNWEIGPGLGANGGPIRNFARPELAGQPNHMNQYRVLPVSVDHGGVHIYSGIHNRAVHQLMIARTADGSPAFPISELVLLLYLTLARLTPTSNFSDSRRTLENVVGVYYASDVPTRNIRMQAIDQAFGSVGIN